MEEAEEPEQAEEEEESDDASPQQDAENTERRADAVEEDDASLEEEPVSFRSQPLRHLALLGHCDQLVLGAFILGAVCRSWLEARMKM